MAATNMMTLYVLIALNVPLLFWENLPYNQNQVENILRASLLCSVILVSVNPCVGCIIGILWHDTPLPEELRSGAGASLVDMLIGREGHCRGHTGITIAG